MRTEQVDEALATVMAHVAGSGDEQARAAKVLAAEVLRQRVLIAQGIYSTAAMDVFFRLRDDYAADDSESQHTDKMDRALDVVRASREPPL